MKFSSRFWEYLFLVAVCSPVAALATGWLEDLSVWTIARLTVIAIVATLMVLVVDSWGWCPSSGWLETPVKCGWLLVMLFAVQTLLGIFEYLLAWP